MGQNFGKTASLGLTTLHVKQRNVSYLVPYIVWYIEKKKISFNALISTAFAEVL